MNPSLSLVKPPCSVNPLFRRTPPQERCRGDQIDNGENHKRKERSKDHNVLLLGRSAISRTIAANVVSHEIKKYVTKQKNRPRVWSDHHLQHFVYLGPVGFQCFVSHQGTDMPAFGEDLDDVMGGGLDQVF